MKKYLVYQTGTPEMGSEGTSHYYHYAVVSGNNEDEAVSNWVLEVERKYGVKKSPRKCDGGYWVDYYNIEINELPDMARGSAKKLKITQ